MGFGGVTIHLRTGLDTKYLGEECSLFTHFWVYFFKSMSEVPLMSIFIRLFELKRVNSVYK